MNTIRDCMTRFVLEQSDVRGEIVVLQETSNAILARADYPPMVAEQLGKACVAALLLSATLKIRGSTSVQARGTGPVTLLMADATHDRTLRGLARWEDPLPIQGTGLQALLGRQAALAITLTPEQGQRYQGIVPLEKPDLATCLEDYFLQSEQLPTRIWLLRHESCWCGLLLQQLPGPPGEQREIDWEHTTTVAETITARELAELSAEVVLHRLFHDQRVRVTTRESTCFACPCSRERTAEMLQSLGEPAVREVLQQRGEVEVHCQFCNQRYAFDSPAVDALFGGRTLH